MNEERRVLVFSIGEEHMHILFTEGAMLRCMVGVSHDAKFLGVHADWMRRSFDAMFEHPSFSVCPEGMEPPRRRVAWEIVEHPCAEHIERHLRFIGTDYNEIVETERGKRNRQYWEG